ncbi:hypothetical protein L873DRAFT_914385 [Choiromyces venosus 120613-1]|uniref:Uncharacterized protein n=1 Tax=Choiromyces venosus 120613-1 TaxID=1336337 RepID=A0A3N4JLY7_9PEZI|nr:hypothetical protein L873DRAFT_914385 [Choiromyces venosus 120613-1]
MPHSAQYQFFFPCMECITFHFLKLLLIFFNLLLSIILFFLMYTNLCLVGINDTTILDRPLRTFQFPLSILNRDKLLDPQPLQVLSLMEFILFLFHIPSFLLTNSSQEH